MHAVILRRRDFRETDQLVHIYTKERGKQELLARGIKKITSKHAAHCEPFSYVQVESAIGRDIDHLIKIIPVDAFSRVRKDVHKALGAAYVVALVDRQIEIYQPDEGIWDLLLGWIRFLDQTQQFDNVLLDGFLLCFFACLGFRPHLDVCVICQKSYRMMVREQLETSNQGQGMRKIGLYFAGGGLICSTCMNIKKSIGENVAQCGLTEISNMQLLLTAHWQKLLSASLSEQEKSELHRLVLAYAQYHSEKEVWDWNMLSQVL